MNWWPFPHHRAPREGHPSPEAADAAAEAARARRDFDALTGRADEATARLAETHRRNHIAEAVSESIKRRIRHP